MAAKVIYKINALKAMQRDYREKYGDMISDLRSNLNSKEYVHAIKILSTAIPDVAIKECSTSQYDEIYNVYNITKQYLETGVKILKELVNNPDKAEMYYWCLIYRCFRTVDMKDIK